MGGASGRAALAVGLLIVLALPAVGAAVGSSGATPATAVADPVVSAAGDIACGTTIAAYNNGDGTATQCRQKYTSELILGSDAVWTLGDHAYPAGSITQFNAAYHPTWGRMKAVTYPTPSDHDYAKTAGKGYFSYFGRPPYYSFEMGAWHVLSLNSEIDHSAGSTQVRWLEQNLASTSANCVAAFWGGSRWTSGPKKAPGDASFDPFWRALHAVRADLVLSADIHNYERFAKQTPAGAQAADGTRQFVVGTGGRSLEGFPNVQPNSQARTKAFGVLQLTLRPGSYDWQFIGETRAVLDSGSEPCN